MSKKRAEDLEPGDFIVLQFNHFPTDVMRVEGNGPCTTVPTPECHQYVEPFLIGQTWTRGIRDTHHCTYTLMKRRERVTVLSYQRAADRARSQQEESR